VTTAPPSAVGSKSTRPYSSPSTPPGTAANTRSASASSSVLTS
jgi:hypothetical protein